MQKSLKIKISITTIWVLCTLLLSGIIANKSYSGFSLLAFLGYMVFFNFPIILYWLGFWIWDEGYLFRILRKLKEKILPIILAFIVFLLIVGLGGLINDMTKSLTNNTEAALNIGILVVALILSIATYKKYSKPALSGNGSEARRFLMMDDPFKKHPWRRYWARFCDYIIWGSLLGLLIGSLPVESLPPLLNNQLSLAILSTGLWAVIESILISTLGTTPCKWLLGIKIKNKNNENVTLNQAFKRSGKVWLSGVALGIPIISLYTLIKSRADLINNGVTSWDDSCETEVLINKLNIFGLISIITILIGFSLLASLGNNIESRAPSTQEIINSSVDEINQSVPQIIDEITTLSRAYSEGNKSLVYEYVVSLEKEEVDASLIKEFIYSDRRDFWCDSEDASVFRDYKIKIIFRYTDINKQPITEVIFDLGSPSECASQ